MKKAKLIDSDFSLTGTLFEKIDGIGDNLNRVMDNLSGKKKKVKKK